MFVVTFDEAFVVFLIEEVVLVVGVLEPEMDVHAALKVDVGFRLNMVVERVVKGARVVH